MLVAASLRAERDVTVDAFIRWVGTTTGRDCKKAVAERQRAAKIAAGLAPRMARNANPAAHGVPRLEPHLYGVDGCADEAVELHALAQAALLDALTAPGFQAERL